MSRPPASPETGLGLIARLHADRAKDPRQWVKVKDVAQIIGLRKTSIGELKKSGQIQYIVIGGATLYNRDSILEWMIAMADDTYGLKEKKADARRAVLERGGGRWPRSVMGRRRDG